MQAAASDVDSHFWDPVVDCGIWAPQYRWDAIRRSAVVFQSPYPEHSSPPPRFQTSPMHRPTEPNRSKGRSPYHRPGSHSSQQEPNGTNTHSPSRRLGRLGHQGDDAMGHTIMYHLSAPLSTINFRGPQEILFTSVFGRVAKH